MSKLIKLKKGIDIKLTGEAEEKLSDLAMSDTYAIKPPDFEGLTPKLKVKVDYEVKAGTTLFFDKYNPEVCFTSPVSGKVVSVNRGERRRILEVVVKPDSVIKYVEFKKESPSGLSRDEIIKNILKSGLWPCIMQRPYATIANPQVEPKAIYISAFDSAPLAPNYDFIVKGQESSFQTGVDALSKLTSGKLHLNINNKTTKSSAFTSAKGVEITKFEGPHPVGNVGIQINQIEPMNKGDIIWYVNPQDVIMIGRLFENGVYDARKIIALTGSEVINPQYYRIITGASLDSVTSNKVTAENNRYISGNVLTGEKIYKKGYLGFYNSQLTVIPEGNEAEFLGWGMPGLNKFSVSRSFISWLKPSKEYKLNTNLQGGLRSFVVSGEYDKVFPMDVLPVPLLKAIVIEDIDLMEELGIYEVAEEDFALCEFVCTSKIEVQSLVRKGLNLMIKEFS